MNKNVQSTKKILILNWRCSKNPLSGGAEKVTLEHAKAWVKKGHNVTWFTSKFKGAKDEEKIEGVNIIRRGNFLTVYLLAPFFYFYSKTKFDFVIDEIHGLPFFTPLFVKKPKIAFIHEVADEIWDYMYPFPLNKIGKIIESLYFQVYKNTRFWTDASSTTEDLVLKGIKKKNCTVINCPVSNKVLTHLPRKEKVPTFIFVSRLVRMKGVEEVIKAFFYIQKQLRDTNLWIVGDGDKKYIKELEDLIKTYSITSRIKFFGHISNDKKLELMKKSHLLLLGIKVHAGWCLVVTEAASQGTPSVVYNSSGLRDAVKNGKTGIVLKENNPKEMAKQAIELLSSKNKYKSYQKNGLLWAKSLTWDKVTAKSLKLLEDVGDKVK